MYPDLRVPVRRPSSRSAGQVPGDDTGFEELLRVSLPGLQGVGVKCVLIDERRICLRELIELEDHRRVGGLVKLAAMQKGLPDRVPAD